MMKNLFMVMFLFAIGLVVCGCPVDSGNHDNDAIHSPTISFHPYEGDAEWMAVRITIPKWRQLSEYLVETSIRTNESNGEVTYAPCTITDDSEIEEIIVNSSFGWGHQSPFYELVGEDFCNPEIDREVKLWVQWDNSYNRNDGYFRGSISVARTFVNAFGDTIFEETYIELGPANAPRWDAWYGDCNDLIVDDCRGGSIIDFWESFWTLTMRPEDSIPCDPILDNYVLSVTIQGEGTVFGAGNYDAGEIVPVTATPDDGWEFDHWVVNGTLGTSDPNAQVTMESDVALVAVFSEEDDPYNPVDPGDVVIIDLTWDGETLTFDASNASPGVIGLEFYTGTAPWNERQVFSVSNGEASGTITGSPFPEYLPNTIRFGVVTSTTAWADYVPEESVIVRANGNIVNRDTADEDNNLAYQVDISTL